MKTQLSDLHYTFYEFFKWTFRTRDKALQGGDRVRIQHDAMLNMVLPLYVQWLEVLPLKTDLEEMRVCVRPAGAPEL
eukprot:4280130-Amphidinium_carterae.1